jgi:hypothetical protein
VPVLVQLNLMLDSILKEQPNWVSKARLPYVAFLVYFGYCCCSSVDLGYGMVRLMDVNW